MHDSVEWLSRREVIVGGGTYDVSELEVDGISFEVSVLAVRPSTVERFSLQKSARMVEQYLRIVADLPARRVVELGIFQGGSTALLGLLPETEVVVAIDFEDLAGGALDQLIEARGLQSKIRPSYRVDQADRDAVSGALRAADLSELDLVIDDASHRYDETVASFDLLFPRLRPGGLFIIEDWRWAHVRGVGLGAEFELRKATPLTRLLFELVMVCGSDSSVIEDVSIDTDMVVVRRGPAELDSDAFRLADHYDEISAALLGDWRSSSS